MWETKSINYNCYSQGKLSVVMLSFDNFIPWCNIARCNLYLKKIHIEIWPYWDEIYNVRKGIRCSKDNSYPYDGKLPGARLIHNPLYRLNQLSLRSHDDVIKWKHFPRYWPFVLGIHRWPVNSPHKGQWRGALMFSLICAWTNGWVNNREAGDSRRHRARYHITVMYWSFSGECILFSLFTRSMATPVIWRHGAHHNVIVMHI